MKKPLYFDTPQIKQRIPREGPKAIPVTAPFALGVDDFTFNILLTTGQKYISLISTVYVDNKDNSESVDIVTGVLAQRLRVPKGAQAYLPLLAAQNDALTLSSDGAAAVGFDFINVQIPALVWDPGSPPPPLREARITQPGSFRTISPGNFRVIQ